MVFRAAQYGCGIGDFFARDIWAYVGHREQIKGARDFLHYTSGLPNS